MDRILDPLVGFCLKNQYIAPEQAQWLRYGLERRVFTFLSCIPLLLLGMALSTPLTAAAFLGSVLLLRRYTNGYHAKTRMGCFFASAIAECLFLGVLGRHLGKLGMVLILAASWGAVVLLAPVNDKNLHLSQGEMEALRQSARRIATGLAAADFVCVAVGWIQYARGITCGMAMAACLLCLAYIRNGGNKDENNEGSSEERSEACCEPDGG